MQQRQPMRPEGRKRGVEIVGEKIGVFVDNENGEIAGDAGGKRELAGTRRARSFRWNDSA